MTRYSLSAVGGDRPGIVAALTGSLAEHGCNLQDSTMATLQGQFAVVLIVSAPDTTSAIDLRDALRAAEGEFDLVIAVRELHEASATTATEGQGEAASAWFVNVHGADRPGIVHGITSAIAALGGNIVDLSTHLVGDPPDEVYTLAIRITVPVERADQVVARVEAAATELGVHCAVRPDDADML